MQVVLAQLWAHEVGTRAGTAGVEGSIPCVVAMHPGWANTPAVARSLPRFHRLAEALLRTPTEGADTAVWLAVAPREKLEPGGFYFDRKRRSAHFLPWTRESETERKALWRLVESLG